MRIRYSPVPSSIALVLACLGAGCDYGNDPGSGLVEVVLFDAGRPVVREVPDEVRRACEPFMAQLRNVCLDAFANLGDDSTPEEERAALDECITFVGSLPRECGPLVFSVLAESQGGTCGPRYDGLTPGCTPPDLGVPLQLPDDPYGDEPGDDPGTPDN